MWHFCISLDVLTTWRVAICGDNVVTNMGHEGEEKQLQWNVSSSMIL